MADNTGSTSATSCGNWRITILNPLIYVNKSRKFGTVIQKIVKKVSMVIAWMDHVTTDLGYEI